MKKRRREKADFFTIIMKIKPLMLLKSLAIVNLFFGIFLILDFTRAYNVVEGRITEKDVIRISRSSDSYYFKIDSIYFNSPLEEWTQVKIGDKAKAYMGKYTDTALKVQVFKRDRTIQIKSSDIIYIVMIMSIVIISSLIILFAKLKLSFKTIERSEGIKALFLGLGQFIGLGLTVKFIAVVLGFVDRF